MSAPNRKKEVEAICRRYPQAFGPPSETQDARRRLLIPIVARELNKKDGGNWGVLYRNDRQDDDPMPGRLTSDVIVWKPTMEHFDVLTANGAMWQGHGPITDPDWDWRDPSEFKTWDLNEPEPEEPKPPVLPPTGPTPAQLAELIARLDALEKAAGVTDGRCAALEGLCQALAQRLTALETQPVKAWLKEGAIVEGSTSRVFGHAHEIRLTVKPPPD
jgi:hypothetical protein